ncbi:sigma-70 family RNA polymerase sigma factor [Nostoc cf. edaphicum LEGE 07299]|uniref:Sigma-70 family RNA polymerase sigma factor n=1 Tax=Nostoc cf. edaphicum LEGE 07299 TaxID=2777974 RepID=A0ABR9TT54_9NOSO|nr:sigma-70 family RNA polymerase sigma factor [Nostoc edaphicum]MBE9103579.1 sigma-70 family RNA polymerase sigma factor [Nostoc cf. edaphicum LEGE 07299]
MQPRQGIVEIFSTFVQFDLDQFSGWATDAKLRRSMKVCLESSTEKSDTFWALYWYRVWQTQSSTVALAHISAYLQEVCYWTARKFALNFPTQSSVADCFQMTIAHINKILKTFNPQYSSHLKAYAELAFESIIKDALRLRREADICSDWALLHKLSRKRLVQSLQNAGFNAESIESYVLAWECFKELYTGNNTKIRQLTKPDAQTWEAISNLYNAERLSRLSSPTAAVNQQTIETWVLSAAKAARTFLYPKFVSTDAPLKEDEGSLLDILPVDWQTSLLTEIIEQEEAANMRSQQTQLNQVLSEAIAALDAESQKVLQTYYIQQLTQQEIAAQLEIKQYTVSRRLSSIKKSLLLTLTQWSQNTLHISPKSDVVDAINASLEEWLKVQYSHTQIQSVDKK